MELVGAGHGVDVSTVPTSRIWSPAFCPIGVQTCMCFFFVPPDFKKRFRVLKMRFPKFRGSPW